MTGEALAPGVARSSVATAPPGFFTGGLPNNRTPPVNTGGGDPEQISHHVVCAGPYMMVLPFGVVPLALFPSVEYLGWATSCG